ncbi:hypothetical protein OH77DRAFT_1412717 [Trametes cingulata]|nr:hypothetical protein OH77DRAFT_1412717 [Trametes cingulata]
MSLYAREHKPLPPIQIVPESTEPTPGVRTQQTSYNPYRLIPSSSSGSSSSASSPISPFSTPSFLHTAVPEDAASASSSHSSALGRPRSASTSRPSSSSHSHSHSHSHSRAHSLTHSEPPSFARRPPNDIPYGSFPPATLFAHSDDLTRGFPMTPPTCPCAPRPHPFTTHDVHEGDWARFLQDVASAGGLTPVHALLADAAPAAVRVGIIAGYLAGKALKAHVKRKRKSPVADVVELWNRRFFHPRCMDVVLAQGLLTYTGPPTDPPDMVRPAAHKKDRHVRVIEDHSDDEGTSSGLPIEEVGAAVDAMGEQLARPAAEKQGRMAFGWDLKHSARERWRIVVSYKPPVL